MARTNTKPRYGFHLTYLDEVTLVIIDDVRTESWDLTDISELEGIGIVRDEVVSILSDPHGVLSQKGVQKDMLRFAIALEDEFDSGGDSKEVVPSVRLSKALGKAMENKPSAFLDPDN